MWTLFRRITGNRVGTVTLRVNLDERHLISAVHHGFDMNRRDPDTGLTWFDVNMAHLHTDWRPVQATAFGSDWHRFRPRSRADCDATYSETRAGMTRSDWSITWLIKILPVASDPTEAFVNLWGKYYHMATMLVHLVIVQLQMVSAAGSFAVSEWAHEFLIGVGSNILRDCDLYANLDPAEDFSAKAGFAPNDIVRQALRALIRFRVGRYSTNTVCRLAWSNGFGNALIRNGSRKCCPRVRCRWQ